MFKADDYRLKAKALSDSLRIEVNRPAPVQQAAPVKTELVSESHTELTTNRSAEGSAKPTVKSNKEPGRNDPCPCGSGKKYKNCCGKNA